MPVLDPADPAVQAFWAERHIATLTTLRPDGRPHVVPVGVTYDDDAGVARIITSDGTVKVRNVDARPDAPVAVCFVDRGRWISAEGTATISREPDDVADAERRYAQRYREPRPNPRRVVLAIRVERMLGRV